MTPEQELELLQLEEEELLLQEQEEAESAPTTSPTNPKEGFVKEAFKTILPATTANVRGADRNAAGEPIPLILPLMSDIGGGVFRLAGSLIPGTRGKTRDIDTAQSARIAPERQRTFREAVQNPNNIGPAQPISEMFHKGAPAPVAAAVDIGLGLAQGAAVSGVTGIARYAKTPKAQKLAMAEGSRTLKAADKISSAMNKISPAALAKASTKEGRQALAGAAQARGAIGDALEELVKAADNMPEKAATQAVVARLKPIQAGSVLDAMDEARKAVAKQFPTNATIRGRANIQNMTRPNIVGEEFVDLPEGGMYGATMETRYVQDGTRQVPTVKGSSVSGGGVSKVGATEAVDKANEVIDGLMAKIKAIAGEDPHTGRMQPISAQALDQIRRHYDDAAKASFDKDYSSYVESVLKAGRSEIARLEREAAKAQGLDQYVPDMDRYHAKLQALDDLKARMGWDERSRHFNRDKVHQNLFGPDKRAAREVLENLDKLFGRDFIERARLEDLALEFGPKGQPGLLPGEGSAKALMAALATGGGLAGPAAGLPVAASAIPAAAVGSFASPAVYTSMTRPALRAVRGSMKLSPSLPVKMGLAGSLAPQDSSAGR